MLVTLNDILPKAQREGYAVGLFNTVSLEMALGVIRAAEEARAPVIIGTAEVLLPYAPLRELAWLLRPMAEAARIPVVLHYDHGLTLEKIREAMDLGYTSVMYDCSSLPERENMDAVAALTREAHARGVTVEAEIGHVGQADADEGVDDALYTQPETAEQYARFTGVDALAVAIGTAHGAYRAKPKLDLERLTAIRARMDTPLVLHGGSGLSDDDFRACAKRGVCKINIFTDNNVAALRAAQDPAASGLIDVQQKIAEAVARETLKKMAVFGCVGKADA